jgi:FkbM family methyltransferase
MIDDVAVALVRVADRLPRGSIKLARTFAAMRPSLRRFSAQTRYGPFVCDLSELACYPLIAKGEFTHWQKDEAAFQALPITRESIVLDIGANIGVMTRRFAERARHVHAFEPSPKALDLLRLNAPENCTIHPIALGEKDGIAHLEETESHDASYIAEMGLRVPMRTVDSLGLDPDFIKIDVEGYEPQVLRGAEQCLKRGTPIMFEALTPEAFAECASVIQSANPAYRISDMGSGENFLALCDQPVTRCGAELGCQLFKLRL